MTGTRRFWRPSWPGADGHAAEPAPRSAVRGTAYWGGGQRWRLTPTPATRRAAPARTLGRSRRGAAPAAAAAEVGRRGSACRTARRRASPLEAFEPAAPAGDLRWKLDNRCQVTTAVGRAGRSAPWRDSPPTLGSGPERQGSDGCWAIGQARCRTSELHRPCVDESGSSRPVVAELRQTTLDAVRSCLTSGPARGRSRPLASNRPSSHFRPDTSAWTDRAAAWAGARGDLPAMVGDRSDGLVASVAGAGIAVTPSTRGARWCGRDRSRSRTGPGPAPPA